MTSIEQMAKYMIDNGTDYVEISNDRMLVSVFGECSGGQIMEVWMVDSSSGGCNINDYPKIYRVLTAII